MLEVILTITNSTGLHARPAAQFVQKAAKFKSKIKLHGNNKQVDAKSILGVLSLGLASGAEIKITADGEDEAECIETLKELVLSKFGEA